MTFKTPNSSSSTHGPRAHESKVYKFLSNFSDIVVGAYASDSIMILR
jgi:hypothetical protein